MPHDEQPAISPSPADVRQFIHDLRNSLYAMQVGLKVLPDLRGDAARFDDLLAMIVDEHRQASARLEEFSTTAPALKE